MIQCRRCGQEKESVNYRLEMAHMICHNCRHDDVPFNFKGLTVEEMRQQITLDNNRNS